MKTLSEIVHSQENADQGGSFEEYRNRKGKVLPGYTPTYESGSKAQYLSETPGEAEQYVEATQSEAEELASDSKKLAEIREEQYEETIQSGPEMVMDDLSVDEERLERIRRQNRIELLTMEQRHARLMEKLDAALAAERQRRADLYAIENHKKNTLDYAYKVYGDEADAEAIFDSAGDAKRHASPEVHSLSEQISVGIDNKLHGKDEVTVVSETGQVHIMDKEVAEALRLYTERKEHNPVLTRAAAGPEAEVDVLSMKSSVEDEMHQYRDEEFEFTRDEEKKLAELQKMINETDKQAFAFEDQRSKAMTPEEYAEYNRQRRFQQYGYPDANVSYDYMMTKEGTYEWNGRPLPSVMSSPTMQREMQRDREMSYQPTV